MRSFFLSKLQQAVPKAVYNKGVQYFKGGKIISLEYIGDGVLDAKVRGSYFSEYDVHVELAKNGKVLGWDCDCPFDGDLCKHVVAVLLKLQSQSSEDEIEPAIVEEETPAPAPAGKPSPKLGGSSKLLKIYESLSTEEQWLVKVAALVYNFTRPPTFTQILSFQRRYIKDLPYQYESAIARQCEAFRKKGLFEVEQKAYRLPTQFSNEFCADILVNDRHFPDLVRSLIEYFEFFKYSRYHEEKGEQNHAFRLMRMGFYTRDISLFQNSFHDLAINQGLNPEELIYYWLPESFDLPKLVSLPLSIRAFLLAEMLIQSQFRLQQPNEYIQYYLDRPEERVNPEFLYFNQLLFQYLLFRGNFTELEKQLNTWPAYEKPAYTGVMHLLSGRYAEARESFTAATRQFRKERNSTKVVLPHLLGVFNLLALFQSKEAALNSKIADALQRNLDSKSYYQPVFQWLSGLDDYLQNNRQSGLRLLSALNPRGPLLTFFQYLILYWTETEKMNIPALRAYYQKVKKGGFDWLAVEVLAILHALQATDKKLEEELQKGLSRFGIQGLVNLLSPIEEWETVLDLFLNLKEKKKNDQTSRLIWLVDFEKFILAGREQKMGKTGWTKGRPVSFHRLAQGEVPGLSNQDMKIAGRLRDSYSTEAYVSNDPEVWKLLIDHPLLFLMKSPDTPVQFQRGEPKITLKRSDNAYELDLWPRVDHPGVMIVKETPVRYRLVEIDEAKARLGRSLSNKTLKIPLRGEEKLKAVLESISDTIPVESVFDEDELPLVEADPRIHLHLLPVGDGFHLEPYVKPFRIVPPYLRPGEGNETVVGVLEGVKHRSLRNLKKEKNQLAELRKKVPVLEENKLQQGIWMLEDKERCLQLLLELHPLVENEEIVLEWPKGEKFSLSKVIQMDKLRLDVRKKGHWFEISGEIPVDEERVLNLQELLALSEGRSSFVEISPGKFLAFTEAFRHRLREAGALINTRKKGGPLTIHPLAAPALQDFFSELGQFKVDKAFKESRKRLEKAFEMKFQVPVSFQAQLRPYQLEGFEWLHRCAAWGVGACLADDMGLGKTIEALAFLSDRASQGPALVVAPASVCRNWMAETKKFAPELRPVLFGEGDRAGAVENAGPSDLLIVTYDLLTRASEIFLPKKFATIVLDEAQAIKNRATRRSEVAMQLQGDFRLIMTGTPLENHLGELWNLFQFINPGLLGSLEQFNERFALPIEKYQDDDRRNQLRRLVQPFMLRRRKDEVLKDLPEKTEITLNVELSEQELSFYEALRRNAIERLSQTADSGAGEQHLRVLAEITRLRRAACHPRLVDGGAGFTSSAKMRLFAEIVDELREGGHKALVFSQFVGHLEILRKVLDDKSIAYQYLDGQTPLPVRQKRIEAFQAGQGEFFLISLKAGGVGLNLTAADYVIHTDPWWNPAVEDQATDRAHRIGQEKPVTVYRLVAQGTIEEKILALHEQKRGLADSLLAGADVSAKLSLKELMELLSAG